MNRIGRRVRLGAVLLLGLFGTLALAASPSRADDAWDAIYISGNKVGHNHIKVTSVKDSQGNPLLRVQVNTVLSLKRGNDRVDLELRYGTIETLDGAVLRLDTRTLAGEQEIKVSGDVVNGKMALTIEGGRQRQTVTIPWEPDVRGPYGAELSLARKPLEPNQTRNIKIFVPDLNQICTTHLVAKQREPVVLGGGVKRELLRVEQTISGPDGARMPEMDSTFWVASDGQVMKQEVALLGGTLMYRTTQEAALAPNGNYDLLAGTIIKVPRKITNSERTRDIVYRVTLSQSDPVSEIPTDHRQTLTAESSRAARLEVKTDSPNRAAPKAEPPDEAMSRPNPLVNSDDATVVSYMRKAVGNETDPWRKAAAIQHWVFQNLKEKNFGTAFASASEVAQTMSGDCTEHGVLAAAMCRAAGIPCRVVVGLVYADDIGGQGPGFGPHLWNEVYINGHWVAIDPTFDQSEVDATHIKLSDSSLDGVAPFEAFLPVLRITTTFHLKLEPLEIR